MTGEIRASTPQVSQAPQTQETQAPKQKEIDRKSTLVGSEKMYRAAEDTANAITSIGRATVGFLKSVTNKVGSAKNSATDTIGQKADVPVETRVSKAEARKSQNVFISFLDKNAKFNEVMENPKSTENDKQKALKELNQSYERLTPKDKEVYRSELSGAMNKVIKNDSGINNIMKEILSTEEKFLASLEDNNKGYELLEKNRNIPKDELERMKSENKVLEREVRSNVAALKKSMGGSDGEKLLALKEHISLNKDTVYAKALEKATVNYDKNLALFNKSKDPAAKKQVENSLVTPVQRGPRYVLLVAELGKKHSDPVFKDLANEFKAQIGDNMARINQQIGKQS